MAVVALAAVVGSGCATFVGDHPFSSAPRFKPSKREKPHPWVNIRPGQADDACAGPPDLDHPVPHLHVAFFFDLLGDRIAPGDTLTITLNGGQRVIFNELEDVTFALHFPAGLGQQSIRAEWQDVTGGTLNHSTAYLNLWTCPGAKVAK